MHVWVGGGVRCRGESWMGTFGGPCCLNMQPVLCLSIEAAVFNIRAQLSPCLFRYSWKRGRDSGRGVVFLFPGSRAALLRFFGGQRDKAKQTKTLRQREKDAEEKRKLTLKTWLQSVLCWLDSPCNGRAPEAQGPPPGRGVWAQRSSLTWWLCPRQITSGAAVTVSLDQDKQPCFKISTCPLTAPSTSSMLRHIHISSQVQAYSLHRSQERCCSPRFYTGDSLFTLQMLSALCTHTWEYLLHIAYVPLRPKCWQCNNKGEHECMTPNVQRIEGALCMQVYMLGLIVYVYHKTSNLAESQIANRAEVSAIFLAFTSTMHLGTCGLSELACLCRCL